MQAALIVDAVRSPIGKRNGSLASIRGDELAAQVLNAPGRAATISIRPRWRTSSSAASPRSASRAGTSAAWCRSSPAGRRRRAARRSTVSAARRCRRNFNAAAAIWSGQLDVVVSAGVEMMSRVPMGSNGGDLSDKLLDRWQIVPQGISAEVLADEWGFSREELDAYLARVAPAADRCDRRGPLRRRDRADRPDQPARGRRLRRGRDAAARHVRRGARRAEAGVPARRAR